MDLLIAGWIITVFLLLFCWWPVKIFSTTSQTQTTLDDNILVRYCARMLFITVVAVVALSHLHLLNFLTLSLVYLSYPIFRALHKLKQEQQTIRSKITGKFLEYADLLEAGQIRLELYRWLQQQRAIWRDRLTTLITRFDITRPEIAAATIMIAAIAGLTIYQRLSVPLQELRLARPESYQVLLQSRQILNSEPIWPSQLTLFPLIGAVVSIFSAIDVMQIIRFLGPLIGILMVGCLGWAILNLTNSGVAALMASYQLGAYTFLLPITNNQSINNNEQISETIKFFSAIDLRLRDARITQWAIGEAELGAFLLLLALICLNSRLPIDRSRVIDIVALLILAAVISPGFAILACLIVVGMMLRLSGSLILSIITILWLLLAILPIIPAQLLPQLDRLKNLADAPLQTLPIALALLLGAIIAIISKLFKRLLNPTRAQYLMIGLLVVYLAVSFQLLLPKESKIKFLEYDISARKTLEIATRFPRKRWMIIAPVEQLAESYGLGWYQDIGQFIEQQQDKIKQPDYQIDSQLDQIFIFVEKRPFNIFTNEPITLPFSILNDPTYRYYRSPAGRASLQFSARQFCESYRKNHLDARVYYDDDLITIYQFTGKPN